MRILIVEDEKKMAAVLKKGLEADNHRVSVAFDGRSGLELASTTEFDVVVLDLMLPVIDGFEVARRLRRNDNRTPILMLTARDAVPDIVKGLDVGADDYLTKPFDLHELLARVRALLRRGPHLRAETLQVGDLTIDTLARRAKRAGRLIELTTKEYALLDYLARHADQVVGRAEIA